VLGWVVPHHSDLKHLLADPRVAKGIDNRDPAARSTIPDGWPLMGFVDSNSVINAHGAILDDDGHVIGVVSTSSHGVSYAALIGGLMELKVDPHGVDGQLGELSIKDLMTLDVIATHRAGDSASGRRRRRDRLVLTSS
jgi:hypothetical protein